jgi:hypothetical protein
VESTSRAILGILTQGSDGKFEKIKIVFEKKISLYGRYLRKEGVK